LGTVLDVQAEDVGPTQEPPRDKAHVLSANCWRPSVVVVSIVSGFIYRNVIEKLVALTDLLDVEGDTILRNLEICEPNFIRNVGNYEPTVIPNVGN
jgi:hypothetical protein